MGTPKKLTSKHLPGLGTEHEVALSGVGISVVTATVALNTVITDANLVGLPPNVTNVPCNVVVHSLGVAPAAFIPHVIGPRAGTRIGPVDVQLVTMDSSAIYFSAWSHTAGITEGASVKFVVIR